MRYNKITGLLILLGQLSCTDSIKSKTEYRHDRAGNPDYKEVEYQYIIGKDEKGNEIEIRTGLTKEFYPDGQIKSEIDFSEGKINGQVKSYFADGTISEISNWTNDLRNGTSKFFYDNGAIYQEENYKDGKLNGEQTTYFDNGKIKARISYKDDFVWQVLVTNDTLGNKLDELTIDKGNGVLNTYYLNGKINRRQTLLTVRQMENQNSFLNQGKSKVT